MDQQLKQLIDRIRQAQNILVTVSTNPSVDQLSAAIGLTIALNKLDKHGTAVFSGEVPSTIDFLKPEDTLEKNTDSLRDFIIALDKSKADKLRYKVEDQVVRIFITPYKTSLSEKDLEFSQGDFNVDVVVALGVTDPADLDTAITSHGRILHDATVASISTVGQGSLGTINWVDPTASSLSEMVANLTDSLDKKILDGQIATALLTGIVASTDRFRNEKTSPKTMSASAALMAAGANQQLIATELETPAPEPESEPASPDVPDEPDQDSQASGEPQDAPKPEPGTLEIDHEAEEVEEPAEAEPAPEPEQPQVHVDEDGKLVTESEDTLPKISQVRGGGSDDQPGDDKGEVNHDRLVDPPKLGDASLTANTSPEPFDPPTEELSLPVAGTSPMLSHNESVLSPAPALAAEPPAAASDPLALAAAPQPAPQGWQPPEPPASSSQPDPITPDTTLTEIEQSVDSPHVKATDEPAQPSAPVTEPTATVDDARSAVEAAYSGSATSDPLQPIAALNAQPLGQDLHDQPAPAQSPFTVPDPTSVTTVTNTGFSEPTPGNTPADDALDMPLPSSPFGPGQQAASSPLPAAAPDPQAVPSAFPGAPQQGSGPADGQTPPPPVPPPMLPPLQ